jgi:hypothetical protein
VKSPCLDAVLDELAKAGIHHPQVVRGAKSYQIRWLSPCGQQRITGASFTPSDVNAPMAARRAVRQILRADGVIDVSQPRSAPVRQLSKVELLERRVARLEQQLGLTTA